MVESKLVYAVGSTLMIFMSSFYAAVIVFSYPAKLKNCAVMMAVAFLFGCVASMATEYRHATWSFFIVILNIAMPVAAAYRLRGWRIITVPMVVFLGQMLIDWIAVTVMSQLLGEERYWVEVARYPFSFMLESTLVMLLTYTLISVITLAVKRLMKNIRFKQTTWRWIRLIGSAICLIVYAILNSIIIQKIQSLKYLEYTVLLYAMCVITVALIMSLIVQDIQYLHQAAYNESLAHKQKEIDDLLLSMRGFRHNIANLLYGMEGAFLSGNASELETYYDQMVEKCRMVNAENIVALQRLPSSTLSAFLLRKTAQAQDARVPLYLAVEPKLSLKGLSTSDMCEILGVLLDNALEATQRCDHPFISVEARDLKPGVEWIIRNTFEGSLTEAASGGISRIIASKDVGLKSVDDILARNPRAKLNARLTGRYVEMQILAG